jgi:hypothetical protein
VGFNHLEDSDLVAFAASTARLAEMAGHLRRVFVCHFLRLENERSLLPEMADSFRRLLAGVVEFSRERGLPCRPG